MTVLKMLEDTIYEPHLDQIKYTYLSKKYVLWLHGDEDSKNHVIVGIYNSESSALKAYDRIKEDYSTYYNFSIYDVCYNFSIDIIDWEGE